MATQTDPPGLADQSGRTVELLESHARSVWLLAVLSYVCGDVITTFVGLQYTPLREAGPLPQYLLAEFGAGALAGLKAGTLAVCVTAWRLLPHPVSTGVPLGLAVVGSTITLWNAALIVFVVV